MGNMTNDKAFIKLYRKMLDWGWYTDDKTKILWLHCLLKANWKPGVWRGIHYNAGEFITSIPTLCRELRFSERQVRTALNHLKSTGEIADRMTDETSGKKMTKGRIITLLQWDLYQGSDSQNNSQIDSQNDRQASGKRQANVRQTSGEEEYKNIKNIKNPKKDIEGARSRGEYFHVTLTDEQYERLVNEKGKEATDRAIEVVDRYCEETGKTYNNYELVIHRWGYGNAETQRILSQGNPEQDENAEINAKLLKMLEG